MSDLRDLYEEVILEHNRNPRNFNRIPEGANHKAYGFNPLCGDEFTIQLTVEDGLVKDVGFEGVGCAISTASASLMTEAIKGKPLEEVETLFQNIHTMLTGDASEAAASKVGKLMVLDGVREYPMRVKCATLAWHTMHAALNDESETTCTE